MNRILLKYYLQQDINPLIPPKRPPVKNVYCLYGINEKTEIGYQYRIVDEAFRLKKTVWEDDGGEIYSTTALRNRKENLGQSSWGKSGDGTVTYNSLNWCQAWHTSDVEITEVPTVVDTSSRLQGLQHLLGIEKLIYGKYRFDSTSEVDGRTLHTSVIEIEHQNHRDIIRSPNLIKLLKEELDPRTNIKFIPFEGELYPMNVKDFGSFSNDDISDMIKILSNELKERERYANSHSNHHQHDSHKSNNNNKDIEEEITSVSEENRDSDTVAHSYDKEEHVTDETLGIDDIVSFEMDQDGGRIWDREREDLELLGENETGEQEEFLDDVRDDDEGSEFRSKEQGGIM